jgi:hypothetical protein
MTLRLALTIVLSVAIVGAGAKNAAAQSDARDAAAAEVAFAEARTHVQNGEYAAACPKFEASFSLDPALGTLLNLADCFEHTGRTASAWLRFRDAAAMALQQHQNEREVIARARVAALEPRLCRLTIHAPDRDGMVVTRDGKAVPRPALALPIPVDPGSHVVEARAPGAAPFVQPLTIEGPPREAEPCAASTVDIPNELGGAVTADASSPMQVQTVPTPSGWHTMHATSVISAGAGLVAFGVSAVFALRASGKKSDGEAQCTNAGCTAGGKQLLTDAGQSADVATGGLIVGAVFVATAAVLWVLAPPLAKPKATLREPSFRF